MEQRERERERRVVGPSASSITYELSECLLVFELLECNYIKKMLGYRQKSSSEQTQIYRFNEVRSKSYIPRQQ